MTFGKGGTCWNCGFELSILDYGRSDTCKKCGRDTKVCKGCIFYDKTYNNECQENQAERVVEKERSNFCDYFKPNSSKAGDVNQTKDAMRSAAEALFKKK